ncbi:MAG TPA: hypothetical protein VGQ76_07265 [Thermoanaerobaculia bacterium]|jgi:hypothetical protein|nr:hypothetical protein [Thermoanaerobaculia bacterium]
MNNVAQTRTTRIESALSATYVLPAILAVNTVALLALDQIGGIPQWLKGAVALFLAL